MVRKLSRSSSSPRATVVDGVSGDTEIANLMASKLSTILNTHSPVSRDSLLNSIQMLLSVSEVQEVTVTEDDVFEAILLLKPRKCDSVTLYSEHLRHACPAISEHLACLFTSCLRHGYMPKCLRDSVIIPIQKKTKIALIVIIIVQ